MPYSSRSHNWVQALAKSLVGVDGMVSISDPAGVVRGWLVGCRWPLDQKV